MVAALALAVAGLVALALAYAGGGTYADIATHAGFERVQFVERDGGHRTMELRDLLGIHDSWIRYITGRGGPPGGTVTVDFFTPDEQAHMADVRRAFIGFELAAMVGAGALAVVVASAARRSRRAGLMLLRDAAIAAGIGTALVAVAAAFAFDPLFLLFHEVLFPQGNFLFGSESNLLALYPDPYWYGVTLRVGLTFVALMAGIAAATTATVRRARR